MPENKLYVYTDASFSKELNLGVAGFLLFTRSTDHKASNFASSVLRTRKMTVTNNIRAEIEGVLWALNTLRTEWLITDGRLSENKYEINLFTDCQSIINLLPRRDKLESTNYMSHRKKSVLTNADLYRQFYEVYDLLLPRFFWVKGHSRKNDQKWIEKNFSYIDQVVRKELRTCDKI